MEGIKKTTDIGLNGTVQFERVGGDTIKCVIQYIDKDLTDAIVIIPDPRVCTGEDVTLRIFLPIEKSPIRCTGRIIARSESAGSAQEGYLARIFIDHISRIDRRRLEIFIARKKAFTNFGHGYRLEESEMSTIAAGEEKKPDEKNSEKLAAEIRYLRENLAKLDNRLTQQRERQEEANQLDTYNILVVDDEIANLNALERTLKALDRASMNTCNVFLSDNGKNALSIMDKNDIGFIIADHRMPGMTGVEFLEKTLLKYPDAIRVILTAYTDDQLLLDAINKVHAYGYISKPWKPEEIITIIRNGFEARKRARILRQFHEHKTWNRETRDTG